MKLFFHIATFFICTTVFGQNDALFNQANIAYNEGNYEQAIKDYERIIDNGQHSSELYFNLGNAHYKLNHIAPSIYNYEKALLLSPNDQEIKNNIGFARNMTIDAVETVPEIGFSKFIKNISNIMSFERWGTTAIALMVLFVVIFLVYYFSNRSMRKRLAFIGSMASLILACVALSFAFHNFNLMQEDHPAIVFAQESQVKSEPNLRGNEAFVLHEGTKVQVLDTVNTWKKIELADGKSGWIPTSDIKMLKNF